MEEIVAAVFAEMSALYGKKFADQWSGVDPETLKWVWVDKLSRYASNPEIIRMALDTCCDHNPWPPTLPEFLKLCSDASCAIARATPYVREPDPWDVIADKRTPEEKTVHQKMAEASIAKLMEQMKMSNGRRL